MSTYNILLDTDSYKASHWLGYPKGLTEMYSYLESRGGKYKELVFFGLQPILLRLAQGITAADVKEAHEFYSDHGEPFNYEGAMYIVNKLDGKLPVEIKAVKEGTIVPTRNVMMTIRNTDPNVPWLTSYLETALLRAWYPITVATRIKLMKDKIRPFYERTADTLDLLPVALLDFSARGVTCYEQAQIGGSAYLANFLGSDNVPAVRYVNKLYHSKMSGFSVPATEHSIMCSYGKENELESFRNLIDTMMKPGGTLSVVSDTWDIFSAAEKWGTLADRIKAKNGTLVVRPDSGDIKRVLPRVLDSLAKSFGTTTNSKGYMVLDNVKVLWGDGIDENTCTLPFEIAEFNGYSADSVLTGSGGGLMQVDINRDTAKFAIKGSNVIIDWNSVPISKDPVTDTGKRSKEGKLHLYDSPNAGWITSTVASEGLDDQLETVFLNGEVTRIEIIDVIRQRIEGVK